MPIPTLQTDSELPLRERARRIINRQLGRRVRARRPRVPRNSTTSASSTTTPNRGRNRAPRVNRRPGRGKGGIVNRARVGFANALRRLVN